MRMRFRPTPMALYRLFFVVMLLAIGAVSLSVGLLEIYTDLNILDMEPGTNYVLWHLYPAGIDRRLDRRVNIAACDSQLQLEPIQIDVEFAVEIDPRGESLGRPARDDSFAKLQQ